MMLKKIFIVSVIFIFGISFGLNFVNISLNTPVTARDRVFDEQEATILAIKKVIPAVVSIIVYDYEYFVPVLTPSGLPEVYRTRQQKLKGTGFLISPDGYILTNKHVVAVASKDDGEYRIILNSGKQYYAQFIGEDPLNDLAVLKIFDKDLPYVELGDSDNLPLGSSVIAVGNALGRYENSVTKGIVSGLGRSLFASDQQGNTETLDNVIQTDAKINIGNSGGPLVNLFGRVIGVNTAIERAGSAIGFAIPINDARPVIKSIIERGRIVRPMLGVRYLMLTPEVALDNDLLRDSGAWVNSGNADEPAVVRDSAADLGGVKPDDIIFEINAIKLESSNTLRSVIQKYKPGDRIGMKILRGNKVIIVEVVLDEFQ